MEGIKRVISKLYTFIGYIVVINMLLANFANSLVNPHKTSMEIFMETPTAFFWSFK